MKNMMVYVVEDRDTDLAAIRSELDLQVDNSLDLGWQPEDILLMTNFPHEHRGVRTIDVGDARRPRTARLTSFHKTRAILAALDRVDPGETVWYHDVDAFQLRPFPAPPSDLPLAFCLYSTRERLLVQGGSMFFLREARPVFEEVLDRLVRLRCRKDEFAITDIAWMPRFAGWFEALDFSYNLGATDFELRYQLARKPIKVVHFHLGRAHHRALFLGRANCLGVTPVDGRFLELLAEHGIDAGCDTGDVSTVPIPSRYRTLSPILDQIQHMLSFAG